MKFGRIGHATLLAFTDTTTIMTDPVLRNEFEEGVNVLDQPMKVDVPRLNERVDGVFLSHSHFDHFDVDSLALLNRGIPIYFPKGDAVIEEALQRMGFEDATPLIPGEDGIEIGDITIIGTPSLVPFPEMGLLFMSQGVALWNTVDTVLGPQVVEFARAQAPQGIDVMVAAFQPLVETLHVDALGTPFPHAAYQGLLQNVIHTAPRAVIPGSCGFRYSQSWMNTRGMPVDERQFLDDVRTLCPRTKPLSLPAGDVVRVGGDFAVERGGLDVVAVEPGRPHVPEYRPDHGVPPLVDPNPKNASTADLRGAVGRLLREDFLERVNAPALAEWRDRFARLRVSWRLEVVYPDASTSEHWIDFSELPLRWAEVRGEVRRPSKVHTSISASALLALHANELTWYMAMFGARGGFRTFNRVYELGPQGVRPAAGPADEPLYKAIPATPGAYVDVQLKRLGF
jgi:L-ascorbate metabolism protein UlaG (beta-lactamase superfamily)